MKPSLAFLTKAPFAHRGLHGPGVPENSLAAFEAACRRGYGIECDVMALADGSAVVFHDEELSRLTGRTGRMADLTAGQAAKLRLGGTDAPPPLLPEVLALVAGRVPLYLELKTRGWPGRLEERVLADIEGYGGPFCLASFNPFSLGYLKRRAPDLVRVLIASDFRGSPMPWYRVFLYRHLLHALIARPHCIAYDVAALPNASVALARALGLPVVLWTIKAREDMDKVSRWGNNYVFEGFLP